MEWIRMEWNDHSGRNENFVGWFEVGMEWVIPFSIPIPKIPPHFIPNLTGGITSFPTPPTPTPPPHLRPRHLRQLPPPTDPTSPPLRPPLIPPFHLHLDAPLISTLHSSSSPFRRSTSPPLRLASIDRSKLTSPTGGNGRRSEGERGRDRDKDRDRPRRDDDGGRRRYGGGGSRRSRSPVRDGSEERRARIEQWNREKEEREDKQ